MFKPLRLLVGSVVLAISITANAEVGCENADIVSGKLITNICWDCLFPVRLAGVPMGSGPDPVPGRASTQPLCACSDDVGVYHPGVLTSFWEPSALVEFQRVPGCSSVLGGTRMPFDRLYMGHHSIGGTGRKETFMHYHYYSFPLLYMLEMFANRGCGTDGYVDLDLLYMSELLPQWGDDSMAFFLHPEAAAVANPVAALACVADATAANARAPIESMFWCAGSWGPIYPMSGNQYTTSDLVTNTSLLSVKALASLHRAGWLYRTMGDDAICEAEIETTFPKDQYKFTLQHPIPETDRAHVVGESVWSWGMGKTIPAVGEDLIYTIWRWKDCCNVTAQ